MIATLDQRPGANGLHSPLLRKAGLLGLTTPAEMIGLAVARGCRHYEGGPEPVPARPPSRVRFSDEELAVALLSPAHGFDPRAIRLGANLVGSRLNQPTSLAALARQERAEAVLRYIAQAGRETEPQEPFWPELLAVLPPVSPTCPEPPPGVLPHPSRFRLETGITRWHGPREQGRPLKVWLRPDDQMRR